MFLRTMSCCAKSHLLKNMKHHRLAIHCSSWFSLDLPGTVLFRNLQFASFVWFTTSFVWLLELEQTPNGEFNVNEASSFLSSFVKLRPSFWSSVSSFGRVGTRQPYTLCYVIPMRLYILCWRQYSRRKLSPTLATPTTLVLTTLVAKCELSRR